MVGLVRLLRQAPGPGLLGELRRLAAAAGARGVERGDRQRRHQPRRRRPHRGDPSGATGAKARSDKSRASAQAAADASAARVVRDAVAGAQQQRQDGSGKTLQGLLGYLLGSGR